MLVFAHRGLKNEYPENTLPAFQVAASLGFGIELDVRLTKDGQLVCLHDLDTERMTDTKMFVRKHTVAELQTLDVQQTGARIPRFLDVVEHVIARFKPGQKAAVHLKADEQGPEQIRILADTFLRYRLYEKAFLFDLKLETAEQVRLIDPRIEIAVSVGEANYAPSIYLWGQVLGHPDLFDAVWWDEWKVPAGEYTQARSLEIRKAGKRLYAISPELHAEHGHPHAEAYYEKDWRNFIHWGLEGVCTAYPRAFQALLKEENPH